jgi:hypothetical protein
MSTQNILSTKINWLDGAIEFHGGLTRWNRYQTIEGPIKIGGVTWSLKNQEEILKNVYFTAHLHRQQFSWRSLFAEGLRSEFKPERVALIDESNKVVDELFDPRDSFRDHTLNTPWTRLQLVYFSSYATWGYMTAPFHFLMPDVQVKEIDPVKEKGEVWKRLEVLYPDHMARHSKRQIYYFSNEGFIRRIDYWPEVLGNSPASHIIEAYGEYGGIKVGTKRRIYILNEANNDYQPEPVLISIDAANIKFND